jgi:hypothetical protein
VDSVDFHETDAVFGAARAVAAALQVEGNGQQAAVVKLDRGAQGGDAFRVGAGQRGAALGVGKEAQDGLALFRRIVDAKERGDGGDGAAGSDDGALATAIGAEDYLPLGPDKTLDP